MPFLQTPLIGAACLVMIASVGGLMSDLANAQTDSDPAQSAFRLSFADGQSVSLPEPTLRLGMSDAEQQHAIEELTREVEFERFLQDSAVAPFVLRIKAVETDQGSPLQAIDVWYCVYASIDQVRDRRLLEELSQSKRSGGDGPADFAEELGDSEVVDLGWVESRKIEGSERTYSRMGLNLFDKVRLEMLIQNESLRSEERWIVVSHLMQTSSEASTWAPITISESGEASLGPSQVYRYAASYTQVTPLRFRPGALLVETHTIFEEPESWFEGRNMLRSKLPPVMQESLRKFRKKLKK